MIRTASGAIPTYSVDASNDYNQVISGPSTVAGATYSASFTAAMIPSSPPEALPQTQRGSADPTPGTESE